MAGRWDHEEKKKKQREAARQAVLQAAQTQRADWQAGASARRQSNAAGKADSKPAYTVNRSAKPAAPKNSAVAARSSTAGTTGSGLRDISSFASQLQQRADTRAATLAAGAQRRRTNTDSRTGTNTSRGAAREARAATLAAGAQRRQTNTDSRTGTNTSRAGRDRAQLQRNMLLWHTTEDAGTRQRLHAENEAIRGRLGLSYDRSGVTYDPQTGRNYSLPTQAVFGGTAAARQRLADEWRQSRDAFGQAESETNMMPGWEEIRQAGGVQQARESRAHEVLRALIGRGDTAWTKQERQMRDQAVRALEDEMDRIFIQHGMRYEGDGDAIQRLRRAHADAETIAYAQENIDQRAQANRLGQAAQAVAKTAVGSIPALIETGRQASANAAASRANPEYAALEQEAQNLENQLTSMQATRADGSLDPAYMEIYERWQAARQRMQELEVTEGVDPSLFGQTMLREAGEAQANATAGLSAVPRFLANTGISIAGNAPGMAASLIPGVGPAVGATLMGAQAAGQRAYELTAQGADPQSAFGRGIASGVIESVTEKLPLDAMADILNRGGTNAVRSILRQMGVEAGEESASYLMNYAADLAARDPEARFSFLELTQQALGGGLSGGFYGAAGVLGGRALGGRPVETVQQAGPVQEQAAQGDLAANTNSPANAGPVSAAQTDAADPQALGQRLAELDAAMRTAESLLPGPARDARIAEIRTAIERTAAQTGQTAQTPAPATQTPAQVPPDAAFRYGATPEQAMQEAEVRAQGEAVQAARENAREEMLNRITYEKSAEIDAQVRKAMERAERVAARHKLRRADTRATPSDADRYINHESENVAVDLVNSLESERFFLRTLRKAWKLTEAELVNAQEIASGRGPVTQMNDHRYELVETYARALRNYWNDMRPAHDFYDEMNAARTRRAEELIVDSDNWEDAKIGYQLSTRTPLRVLRKVMGDTEQMRAIYEAYFAPVIQHDAESVRWENNMRNRLKDIIKGLSHEDSVYIHLKNRLELNPKNETLQKLYVDYVEKHQKKIHFAEADAAMEKLIEFTQDLHPQINEAWVRNGIDPLEFHRRYLPSITPTKEGKWYNRILRGIGIETMADELPDEIAGRTENRRPGHQYASFAEERQGVNLEFDAFKAMDNYISNAATAIFHTDDIQNLRTLEETIRFKNADEGEQAALLAIMQNPSITIEDRVQQMSKIWEESQGNLPHFPSWIAEYTNLLAGKKARGDRQMESDLSRGMFRAMSDLEGKVAANMVGANLSTALSNFIPLTQGAGELRYSSMARAMLDYTYDLLKKDSMFRDTSDFLTNRRGSDRVAKTRVQKASDMASIPVRAVDRMTSEVLTRARYIDNTKRGLSHQEALREADRWAAGLMGDRSKGAKPIVFDEKGPLKKAFTMFQLEVANQYDYLFGDIPANARAQGKGKAAVIATTAGALLQIFILSHLFNDAREKMTGTRSALDPIEIVNDFVGRATGYAMPNVFTMIQEAFAGDLRIDDFQVEASESVWDNAKTTLQDVASNVPFLSGPVGALFGASNSRLPIQSVVPDIDSILSKSGAARTEAAIKELAKPIYGIVLPFGGTQIKKTAEGIATMLAGGSYVHDNDGNLKLQFPAYGESPLDWARAAVFGKWSSPEAQEYIDNGFKGLSADETSVYNYLRDTAGVEPRQAMDVITSLRGFESVKDSEGNTVQTVKDQQRLALFDNENLTPEQKAAVDRALIVSGENEQPADYSDRNAFLLGQYVSESRRDAAREAISHGLDIDQFVTWDGRLGDLKNEKGEDGKAVRTAAEARHILLDEVMGDSTLSEGEKQTIADYIVISSMGDSQREDWETIARGTVSAADYVRFAGDVDAYKEEYRNTGADNSANVAAILRGYEGLTDEQRDVLFQTYRDNMSVNPFHVSVYEKSIDQNGSFYGALTDDGKARLRSLLNEYEQDINEGAELDEWRAKAYMAEKEAGISPATYAMYRVALETANTDDKGNPRQSEAEACVNAMDGLTQYQKAYLYQSTNSSWKKNPFGSASVTRYGAETAQAVNPVEGGTLSSAFGPRSAPTSGASSWHKAVDIAAAAGTPVRSVMGGTVVAVNKAGYGGGYGVSVRVDHGNGYVTEYHHMQEGSVDGVNVGDTVEAGQEIGKVGSTGVSTGPHLDMQAWKDGQIVDPLTVIPGYGSPSGYVYNGTVSSGVVSSGAARAKAKSSGSAGSGGLKSLKGLKRLG